MYLFSLHILDNGLSQICRIIDTNLIGIVVIHTRLLQYTFPTTWDYLWLFFIIIKNSRQKTTLKCNSMYTIVIQIFQCLYRLSCTIFWCFFCQKHLQMLFRGHHRNIHVLNNITSQHIGGDRSVLWWRLLANMGSRVACCGGINTLIVVQRITIAKR